MKKISIQLLILFILSSCTDEYKYPTEKYPKYSLIKIDYVPDSLKEKHREWIKETIRASNQHLSAGDYENVDETVFQVERTGDRLFEVEVIGLLKQTDEFHQFKLKPDELNDNEIKILNSLLLK